MQITKIFKYKYKDRSKYTNISGILEFGRDTVGCTRASFGGKQAEALAASLANLLLRTYMRMKIATKMTLTMMTTIFQPIVLFAYN